MKFMKFIAAACIPVSLMVNAAVPVDSFFPMKDVTQFLVQRLDLSTFRNSLGPRRTETQRTFAALGIKPTQILGDAVILEDDDWSYRFRVLRREDINGDGLEDLEVCFTDRAKQGTYNAQQALLVTRYSEAGYAVALKYEVDGCEAYAR